MLDYAMCRNMARFKLINIMYIVQQWRKWEAKYTKSFRESEMDPELYNAAREGEHGFLERIPSRRRRNEDGSSTPDEGYFIERTTDGGDNILHVAAQQGHEEFVEVALKKLPVSVLLICQKNNMGENPLHVAAEFGHLGIAKRLVDAYRAYQRDVEGATRSSSLMHLMIEEGGVAAEPWRAANPRGMTPLHKAMENRHEQLAVYLLGEDPELACFDNNRDESPLYLAAAFGWSLFAEKILASNVECSVNGPSGATPLHVAVYASAEDIVELLLQKRPEIIRKADSNMETALHSAAKTEQVGITELILRADSSLEPALAEVERLSANQRDSEGFTPLLRAATMGLVEIVSTILQYSPQSIAICDSNGRSALHLIRPGSYHEGSTLLSIPVIQRLVNEPDSAGNTPMHLAVERRDHIMAEVLLNSGNMQPCIKNKDGLTPRDMIKCQQALSDGMVEIGYQLIMQEKRRQIYPENETIDDTPIPEEIPERSSEAIHVRTPIVEHERPHLQDVTKGLHHNFNNTSVIAAIFAAISIAAILAAPGGFNENGTPQLENRVAFKVFMISNTSAMCGYVLVLFCVLWATGGTQEGDKSSLLLSFGVHVLQLSFYATLAAFAAGAYALMSANTFWLAVVLVCIPACVIILTLPRLLFRLARMLLRLCV